jgi:hypothetical protein
MALPWEKYRQITNRLTITEGGEFNGQIKMKEDEPDVSDFGSANPEIVSISQEVAG